MAERDPRPGDLLVASVALADGVFNATVVLVLDADADGAVCSVRGVCGVCEVAPISSPSA